MARRAGLGAFCLDVAQDGSSLRPGLALHGSSLENEGPLDFGSGGKGTVYDVGHPAPEVRWAPCCPLG